MSKHLLNSRRNLKYLINFFKEISVVLEDRLKVVDSGNKALDWVIGIDIEYDLTTKKLLLYCSNSVVFPDLEVMELPENELKKENGSDGDEYELLIDGCVEQKGDLITLEKASVAISLEIMRGEREPAKMEVAKCENNKNSEGEENE